LKSVTATLEGDTVAVRWSTASELDTSAFRIYRAQGWVAPPADPTTNPEWVLLPNSTIPATGNQVTGNDYEYIDQAPGQDVINHYLLAEITRDNRENFYGDYVANVTIGVPPQPSATASATATATAKPGATATRTATASRTPVRTSTPTSLPPPTATRQFPNTPLPTATAAGSRSQSPLPTPVRPTALPGAKVTSPTPIGGVRQPPTVRVLPSATPTLARAATQARVEAVATPSPTATEAITLSQAASPTPLLSVTQTPQVFEPVANDPSGAAESRGRPRSTPTETSSVRSARLALVWGGGAIVMAIMLIVGGLAFWRARQR
jgi:hypothetical protein